MPREKSTAVNANQRVPSSTITIHPENLSEFSSDVQALWSTPIQTLSSPPSPLEFYRDYVSVSKPVLIHNVFPQMSLDAIVESTVGGEEVRLNVDVTPDGHGDCIRTVNGERMFVMPECKEMTLLELREGLRKQQQQLNAGTDEYNAHVTDEKIDENGLKTFSDEDEEESQQIGNEEGSKDLKDDEIFYYSRQNDCLRSELQALTEQKLFPENIPFANEAFNAHPEAVNLWIGNEKSVSSMHKDHYENLYCVAHGEKLFTLCPPCDALVLKESNFPSGIFKKVPFSSTTNNSSDDASHVQSKFRWKVERQMDEDENDQMVRWIESDVEKILPSLQSQSFNQHDASSAVNVREDYLDKNPLLKYAHPQRIHVKAGDMLYLPSLWYHRVTSTRETVAVNYWYEMRFDSPGWCYFNMLQHLKEDV